MLAPHTNGSQHWEPTRRRLQVQKNPEVLRFVRFGLFTRMGIIMLFGKFLGLMKEEKPALQPQHGEACQHDLDFRLCLMKLEERLHSSESTAEIMQESLCAACEFYDTEFAGILLADINTEAWAPVVCYSHITGNHISRYTKETESFVGFSRWMKAFYSTTPVIIPDTDSIKESNPDEYAD